MKNPFADSFKIWRLELNLNKVKQHEVLADFGRLLENQEFVDVYFEIDGKTVGAHKCVLSCKNFEFFQRKFLVILDSYFSGRSKTFNAMFKHDFRENHDKTVKIDDVDYDAFYELLRFIYCGRALNLEQVALSLLPAADKYGILALKAQCENHLNSNIYIENVLEVLVIADLHSCEKLKRKSIVFIARYFKPKFKFKFY